MKNRPDTYFQKTKNISTRAMQIQIVKIIKEKHNKVKFSQREKVLKIKEYQNFRVKNFSSKV